MNIDAIKPLALSAIIEPSPKSREVWVFDLLEQERAETIDCAGLGHYLGGLAVLTEAKTQLQQWQIPPHPERKVICLSTIKQLVAKSIHDGLKLPTFASQDEAFLWIKAAVEDAFSRISKLNMSSLVALECQVIQATIAMETRGIPFNQARWQNCLEKLAEEMSQLKAKLHALLPKDEGFLLFDGDPVDLNNHQAVKQALEKVLNQTLPSTSYRTLKDFDNETIKLFLDYREHARMLSVYGEGFLEKIHLNRIKGHFVPIGSASGRFACHEPNLLALPHHLDFQACIDPGPDYEIMHFDYSGFELRILAALSGDETLLAIFNEGQDIHSMVAQEVFKVPVSKTTNAHLRDQAKVLNFGIIYGMGEAALARQLKISLHQSKTLLSNYFKRFKRVKDFLHNLETTAKTEGFVHTALNRRAYFSLQGVDEKSAARFARNMPIQGTGADIIKLALCRVYKRLHDEAIDAHVINAVHDELVVECHREERKQACDLVKQEMEQAFNALCPEVLSAVESKAKTH